MIDPAAARAARNLRGATEHAQKEILGRYSFAALHNSTDGPPSLPEHLEANRRAVSDLVSRTRTKITISRDERRLYRRYAEIEAEEVEFYVLEAWRRGLLPEELAKAAQRLGLLPDQESLAAECGSFVRALRDLDASSPWESENR